ncbi:MAG: NUDIX domain-containing protein [Polyangiaceae bacterium]
MNPSRYLPFVPEVRLEVVEDLTPTQPDGFCRLVRQRLQARGPAGQSPKPFVYDWLERRALDAVVVAAYFWDSAGAARVYLRSATRPPVALRSSGRLSRSQMPNPSGHWELAAGLLEDDEETEEGPARCACRELEEELGFAVEASKMLPLGPSTLPAPGVVGERHFFFRVQVDPSKRAQPSLDGSALEQLGAIIDVPLADALAACRNGEIEDAKTELGLRRLAEVLGRTP